LDPTKYYEYYFEAYLYSYQHKTHTNGDDDGYRRTTGCDQWLWCNYIIMYQFK